jgi:hypothetical protein
MIVAAEECGTLQARLSELSERRWRSFTLSERAAGSIGAGQPAAGAAEGGRERTLQGTTGKVGSSCERRCGGVLFCALREPRNIVFKLAFFNLATHTTHESRLHIILQHSRIIIRSSPWLVLPK